MKHIKAKDLSGKIKLDKKSIGDIIELTRISPVSTRILLLISAYVDKHNSLITTVDTLSYMLNLKNETTSYGIRKLFKEGFIDLCIVKLDYKNKGSIVKHDEELYFDSGEKIWEVISRERASILDLTGRYLKIMINPKVITGTKERDNRVLFKVKDSIFFDKDINENEIGLSYWL